MVIPRQRCRGGYRWLQIHGGSNGRQEDANKIESAGFDYVCHAGVPLRPGDYGNDRETTSETTCLREQIVRRIVGINTVDRRRVDELREDIGVQMSLTGRLVKCSLR